MWWIHEGKSHRDSLLSACIVLSYCLSSCDLCFKNKPVNLKSTRFQWHLRLLHYEKSLWHCNQRLLCLFWNSSPKGYLFHQLYYSSHYFRKNTGAHMWSHCSFYELPVPWALISLGLYCISIVQCPCSERFWMRGFDLAFLLYWRWHAKKL